MPLEPHVVPGWQIWHAAEVLLPVEGLNLPGGQGAHAEVFEPQAALNVPEAQVAGADIPLAPHVAPGGQGMHADAELPPV